jgi:hypothetical protein
MPSEIYFFYNMFLTGVIKSYVIILKEFCENAYKYYKNI